MKQCPTCHITIDAPRHYCPLCGGPLKGGDGSEQESFPVIAPLYKQYNLLFRIIIFVSIVIGVASVLINLLLPQTGWWSMIVLMVEGGAWLLIVTGLRRRTSLSKQILWQVVMLLLVLTAADGIAGWKRWSVNYVIPLTLVFTVAVILIVEFVISRRLEEYLVYLIVCSVLDLIPILLYLIHVSTVLWPAMVSTAASILTVSALFLFAGENTWEELKRRLHM